MGSFKYMYLLQFLLQKIRIMDNKPKQRKKKHIAKPQYKNMNAFKAAEKHFKLYQGQETDFSALYSPSEQDFMDINGYKVCELPFPEGAYIVKNFSQPNTILEVGLRGLNQFCHRPYRTNLDSREELYQEEKDVEEQAEQKKEQMVEENTEQLKKKGYTFNEKIRWANVGLQYDWTLRKYPDKKTAMHPLLRYLTDKANDLYNTIQHTKKNYEPEAAIINYYGLKDYMTGHLDDAEEDQTSPIYSFSFGLSCVFVIGGPTKEEKPTSVRLDSGDLMIMAGNSRKSYHGVPRVVQNSFEPFQKNEDSEKIEKEVLQAHKGPNGYNQVVQYFKKHRININIRQVFPRE